MTRYKKPVRDGYLAYAYMRQDAAGESLAVQRERITEYAEQHGLEIPADRWYTDLSGYGFAAREDALDALHAGGAAWLLVSSALTLADDLLEILTVRNCAVEEGWTLVGADGYACTGSPVGSAAFTLQGVALELRKADQAAGRRTLTFTAGELAEIHRVLAAAGYTHHAHRFGPGDCAMRGVL